MVDAGVDKANTDGREMITQLTKLKLCQWNGCVEIATTIAAGYEHKGKNGHPKIGCFCDKHAMKVADDYYPEYTVTCPNCKCLFGVN